MADKDSAKGPAKKTSARTKEKGERAFGDRKSEAERGGERILGETRNTWGKVKDKSGETTGKR